MAAAAAANWHLMWLASWIYWGHSWLIWILLLLILYQGTCVLWVTSFGCSDDWRAALRSLMSFQSNIRPTQYLITRFIDIRSVVARWLGVEIAYCVALYWHAHTRIGWILDLEYLLATLNALPISWVLHLTDRHLDIHIEFSDTAASRYSHASCTVAFTRDVCWSGRAVGLHALLHGLVLYLLILELDCIFQELLARVRLILYRVTTRLTYPRCLFLRWWSKIHNIRLANMLLVCLLRTYFLLITDWRLSPVVYVTAMRLSYLLAILLNELCRRHTHLLLHR